MMFQDHRLIRLTILDFGSFDVGGKRIIGLLVNELK